MTTKDSLIKKRYGNIVEGPSGFKMPERVAREIEDAAKTLPKDFAYQRRIFSTKQEEPDTDARTEVSVITSDAVDRDGECVLPDGGDWSTFNKCVPFCHRYDELPAGFNQWIAAKGRTIKAKTQYPTKPADWGDAPWLPSAVWHFITQPVPTMGDKSIGFLPMNVRMATPQEKKVRPELDGVPIIDKWMGLEYSVVAVPCNPEAQLVSVAKMLKEGTLDSQAADLIKKSFIMRSTKTVVAMPKKLPTDTDLATEQSKLGATEGVVTLNEVREAKAAEPVTEAAPEPEVKAGSTTTDNAGGGVLVASDLPDCPKCKNNLNMKPIEGKDEGYECSVCGSKVDQKDDEGADTDSMKSLAVKDAYADGPNDPDHDGDQDILVFCPQCRQQAKQSPTGVDVSGLGHCDSYACTACGYTFLAPDGNPRSENPAATTDGTEQQNVDPTIPIQIGGPHKAFVSPATAKAVANQRHQDKLKTVIGHIGQATKDALDRRMGRV